jgi:hypothetical protein
MRSRSLRERVDKEMLHRLYWDDGLSTKQIAMRLKSYSSNVIALMEKYGIPRRSRGGNNRAQKKGAAQTREGRPKFDA